MEAQPRRIRAATQAGIRPRPKNDGLARCWPNGDDGRWQLYIAGFTQEEIAGDCLRGQSPDNSYSVTIGKSSDFELTHCPRGEPLDCPRMTLS